MSIPRQKVAQQGVLWAPTASTEPAAFASEPKGWPVAADWQAAVDGFFASIQGQAILSALRRRVDGGEVIFPAHPLRALQTTPLSQVKVVVLGQDPYPTAGHADGLAFSSMKGRPKSLARIAQVLAADKPGWQPPAHSRLDAWAEQGVLLINTALTVTQGQAGSHLEIGWRSLTAQILQTLASRRGVTFMLWGAHAQRFADAAWENAPPQSARVLRSRHPSYDFQQKFMAEGSHFAATAQHVDWWAWR